MKSLTVKELKRGLTKLPDNAIVYAYEGEVVGIVVVAKRGKDEKCEFDSYKELKFFPTHEPKD